MISSVGWVVWLKDEKTSSSLQVYGFAEFGVILTEAEVRISCALDETNYA